MGHSVKFQSEVLAKDLEAQAEKMLEQVLVFRNAGRPAMADQVLAQHDGLLEAIAALRALNKLEEAMPPNKSQPRAALRLERGRRHAQVVRRRSDEAGKAVRKYGNY